MPIDDRPKANAILDSAMALLCEHGDHGMTMRKIASHAGISLGHLQHYFATKHDVLGGLVSMHFTRCADALTAHADATTTDDPRARVAALVSFGLDYVGGELSDTCRLFREFWALAPRHQSISDQLDHYYQTYAGILSDYFAPIATSPANANAAVTLLLPWFEGYSLAAKASLVPTDHLTDWLTDLILNILTQTT